MSTLSDRTLTRALDGALASEAAADAATPEALEPETTVERPNGRFWRRRVQLGSPMRPRVSAWGGAVVVSLTHREELAKALAAAARPDWRTITGAQVELRTRQGWYRRHPSGPAEYPLATAAGDAHGTFPGVLVWPAFWGQEPV